MKQENQEILVREQKRMVAVLKDVRIVSKVEFKNFDKNNATGTYSVDAIVDDKYMIRFFLDGLQGEIILNEVLSYSLGAKLQKGKTTTAIEVIYYSGEK